MLFAADNIHRCLDSKPGSQLSVSPAGTPPPVASGLKDKSSPEHTCFKCTLNGVRVGGAVRGAVVREDGD